MTGEYQRNRRKKFKEENLCVVCGKRPPISNHVKCEICNEKAIIRQRKYYKNIRERYNSLRQEQNIVDVLDKIRAEIETKIKEENYGVISDHTHEDGLEEALEIIDKYTKGESE